MKRSYAYTIVWMLSAVGFTLLVTLLHKWNAQWDGVHIGIYTAIAMIFVAFGLTRLKWWKEVDENTSWTKVVTLVLALVISTFVGINYTDQKLYRSVSTDGSEPQIVYYANYVFEDADLPFSDIEIDSDDDGGFWFIIGAVLLVLGSAFIPHFWVLSGCVLLTMLGMIAIRQYRVWE